MRRAKAGAFAIIGLGVSRAKLRPSLNTLDTAMLDRIRIVMVETTHPGNIGAAARAMNTMGLSDLRLIKPLQFPHVEATARASGSADILARAQVCADLDEALAGATLVVGTSARQRRIPWPCLSPRQFGEVAAGRVAHEQIAVLFGREDRGLTNEELQRCHYHVAIPANPDYGVLNVAAAVQLICYELRLALVGDPDAGDMPRRSRSQLLEIPPMEWDAPVADSAEVEHFLRHLEQLIIESGFLDPDNPAQVMTRLRRLFLRARPDKMEISTLRGVLTSFGKHLAAPSDDAGRP
ncbi:RNA methyltransferase [Alcanivorax sp. S71-1-4]|nr:RNA methyltransferase [Alcanivorax sp. S71-1-4]